MVAENCPELVENEVWRILRSSNINDIRKNGIKCLPSDQLKKAREKQEGMTNLCGYASYYLAEQWDYENLENKESLR